MSETTCVTVTREDRFRFLIDFGPGVPEIVGDEPPPLGSGADRSLSGGASGRGGRQLHVLEPRLRPRAQLRRRSRTAHCDGDLQTERNESNRLEGDPHQARIALGAPPDGLPHLDRALAQFEEFCTVSQSVRAGVPLTVNVLGPDGRTLK